MCAYMSAHVCVCVYTARARVSMSRRRWCETRYRDANGGNVTRLLEQKSPEMAQEHVVEGKSVHERQNIHPRLYRCYLRVEVSRGHLQRDFLFVVVRLFFFCCCYVIIYHDSSLSI